MQSLSAALRHCLRDGKVNMEQRFNANLGLVRGARNKYSLHNAQELTAGVSAKVR